MVANQVATTNGGVAIAMTSPFSGGSTATFNVRGNLLLTVPTGLGFNLYYSTIPGASIPASITMNLGQTGVGGTGGFTMTSGIIQANPSGTVIPTINFLGGTLANPAVHNVVFGVQSGGTPSANANITYNVNGVVNVIGGSSFGISRNQTLTINGTVIVDNSAEITGVNIGTASGQPHTGIWAERASGGA
ncbi:MAG: hypothetical protein CMR00_04100 [[Chlorobium] sp. 445]|nr:MAG: hypothetical protein CMR00_04100 [[Chlorobium] sp. 445]